MKEPSQVRGTVLLICCCFVMAFAAHAVADAPRYTIEKLELKPEAINNHGQVVGTRLDRSGNRRAFLLTNGVLKDLGTLGGGQTLANDINDSGQVTGRSGRRAFLYSDGVMQDLGSLSETSPISTGWGLNDAGEVTGESQGPVQFREAFLYSAGAMRSLGISSPCGVSVGYDVNNSSQVAGEFFAGGCIPKAFLHSNGQTLVIGDLLPDFGTIAYDINDSGQVVMQALPLEGTGREAGGYLYTEGMVERIGDMPLIPWEINNDGWIVGTTGIGGESARAFLYIDGELYDLTELATDLSGWRNLQSADGINDVGQIVGEGRTADGAISGFLLTPLAVKVRIDIKPGSTQNPVNLVSNGNVAVAILSTGNFDATQVNWETVTFGPREAAEVHERAHLRDVDNDGDMDFVAHFKIRETGIRCGDTTAMLTGRTFDGQSFTGRDAVKVTKCR